MDEEPKSYFYDVIVAAASHDGLSVAAYLAKARVARVSRRVSADNQRGFDHYQQSDIQ